MSDTWGFLKARYRHHPRPCGWCGRAVPKTTPAGKRKRADGWYWHNTCWQRMLKGICRA